MTAAALAFASLWAVAGFGFGLFYFAALRRTVEGYRGGRSHLLPIALTLGRIAAAVLFFGSSAAHGVVPLLTAFLGFLLARSLALRAARRPA